MKLAMNLNRLRDTTKNVLTTGILLCAVALLSAQTNAQNKTKVAIARAQESGSASPKKQRDVHFTSKGPGTRNITPSGVLISLSREVEIRSEDTVLHTDEVRINDTTKIATSPGKLQIDDAQNTIIGDTGIAYYKTRDAKISGKVKIIVRPKPSDRNAPEGSARREFKEPATITCDLVLYNWRTRKATATGNLTLRQKNRTITADKGLYDGRTETVTLIGNVRYRTDDGEKTNGSKGVAVLKEGAESFRMDSEPGKPIDGVMHIDDEDDTSNTNAQPDATKPDETKPASPDAPTAPGDSTKPVPPMPVNPAPTAPSPSRERAIHRQ